MSFFRKISYHIISGHFWEISSNFVDIVRVVLHISSKMVRFVLSKFNASHEKDSKATFKFFFGLRHHQKASYLFDYLYRTKNLGVKSCWFPLKFLVFFYSFSLCKFNLPFNSHCEHMKSFLLQRWFAGVILNRNVNWIKENRLLVLLLINAIHEQHRRHKYIKFSNRT